MGTGISFGAAGGSDFDPLTGARGAGGADFGEGAGSTVGEVAGAAVGMRTGAS